MHDKINSWRLWLACALFESGVILAGLLIAFTLSERQDTLLRVERTSALVAAIRNELEANLALQRDAVVYNSKVAEEMWGLARSGELFVPADLYPRGLVQRPPLTSAAWDLASDGALDDIPVNILVAVAAAYREQDDYLTWTDVLLSNIYAGLMLQREGGMLRVEGVDQPLGIGGMLGSHASRGTRLIDRYQTALEQLNGKTLELWLPSAKLEALPHKHRGDLATSAVWRVTLGKRPFTVAAR